MATKTTKNTKSKSEKSATTSKNNRNKSTTEGEQSVRSEVYILLLLATSILMLISNFGIGGFVGDFISSITFGLFGFIGYIFPIILFTQIVFYYVNKKNEKIYVKLVASMALFITLCTLIQLFAVPYDAEANLFSFYTYSSANHAGGGIVSGILVKLLCPAIGVIGTYILLLVFILISCVVISEKSFIKGVKKHGGRAKNEVDRRKEDARVRKVAKREEREKQQSDEKNRRTQHVVSGVSFDTTLKKANEPEREFITANLNEMNVGNTQIPTPVAPTTSEQQGMPALFEEEAVKTKKPRKTKESKQAIEEETHHIEEDIKARNDSNGTYVFPPIDLLGKAKGISTSGEEELRETACKLQQTLQSFGVKVQITDYSKGPSVTRYELQPESGVKVSRIVGLADDIKLNLAAADIRIEAPIPGKAAVGIEVPNKENATVALRSLLESKEFITHPSNLSFAAGKDIGGKTVVADIAKMPHVLIAGSTGSGKSVCINTLIMSILYKANPEDVKLIMIDPKVVELSVYNGIPHLLIPVVTDPKKAAGALHWAVAEMTKRYQLFAEYNVRDLKGYNDKIKTIEDLEVEDKPTKMPQIVVIVDELADLMMVAPGDVEEAICRLAQLARAAGIHLILATQRPSVNVITGLIKANMPSRIAFAVSSGVDSRTIIDMNGAEKLLGKGDMLFYPTGYPKPARVQGAFVSDKEVQKVVQFLIEQQGEVVYNEEVQKQVTSSASGVGSGGSSATGSSSADQLDAYFVDAGKFIIEKDKASIGMLQRVFKIGFNRAARIMDQLCDAGVVGEEEGTKPRKVLMSMEEFNEYIEECV